MATEIVPAQASGGRVVEAWWFGFLVRSLLALFALWTLLFAADRYHAFGLDASAGGPPSPTVCARPPSTHEGRTPGRAARDPQR